MEPGTAGDELGRLLEVMRRLRTECPWDRGQDLRSLRPYLIEEAFEVLDALDAGDPTALQEELGDLLFQIVFQSRVSEEAGNFGMADVVRGIADKLERRHPQVFNGSGGGAHDAEGAQRSWTALKLEERHGSGGPRPSVVDGIPSQAPALLRAERLGSKVAHVGFDWSAIEGVRAKVSEELDELDEAIASGDRRRAEEELGDLLFSLCNLARWLRTPAEDALRGATARFEARFRHLELVLAAQGRQPVDATPEELARLWVVAKQATNR